VRRIVEALIDDIPEMGKRLELQVEWERLRSVLIGDEAVQDNEDLDLAMEVLDEQRGGDS